MPVFKLCLKIFKKNYKVMSIYFAVFILVSVLMMSNNRPSEQAGFSMTKARMVVFSEESTPLIDGLKEDLSQIVVFKDLEDSKEAIQDALYFRDVHYVLRIPSGFTEDFMAGNEPVLSKTGMPDNVSNIYIDLRIEQFLNTARLYVKSMPGIDQETLSAYVREDLSHDTPVAMLSGSGEFGRSGMMQFYFNYLAYTFMFVIIMGVSTVMLVFNDLTIKRRNACAPIPAAKVTLQFFLAIMTFTLISWVILVSLSLAFGRNELSNPNTIYFIFNSLVFALTGAGISFFIGNLVKGREAISGIANIVTLGSCFISGVFVPQAIMTESVLRIASFLPTYWYVKANEQIATMTDFSLSSLNGLTNSLLIQLGFGLAFFVLAMVVGKKKRLALEES